MRFKAPEQEKKTFINYYQATMKDLEKEIKKVIDEDSNKTTIQ